MVLSVYDDADKVFTALKAGTSGNILKNTPANKLIKSLIELQKGGSPMSSQIARMVVSAFQQKIPKHLPQTKPFIQRKGSPDLGCQKVSGTRK